MDNIKFKLLNYKDRLSPYQDYISKNWGYFILFLVLFVL